MERMIKQIAAIVTISFGLEFYRLLPAYWNLIGRVVVWTGILFLPRRNIEREVY